MRPFRSWLGRLVVAVVALAIVPGVIPGVIVVLLSHRLLTVDSGEVKADALVVLGGGSTERSKHAAELFLAGAAPRIIVSGTGDCWMNRQILEQRGVPASAITVEPDSKSTLENARFSAPILRQMGVHRVVLVTSWYHSRRALACFRNFAPDITFYSRPSYEGFRYRTWVRHPGIIGFILRECIKVPGYWIVYGVSPVADT